MITIHLFDQPNGEFLADFTTRAVDLTWTTTTRGDGACSFLVPMAPDEAWRWLNRGYLHCEIVSGATPIWEGQVEGVALVNGGVRFTAYGYSRAFVDTPYTAFWSMANMSQWKPVTIAETNIFTDTRFAFTSGTTGAPYLAIAPKKNEIFGTTGQAKAGGLSYTVPQNSRNNIAGLQLTWAISSGPAGTSANNWVVVTTACTYTYTTGTSTGIENQLNQTYSVSNVTADFVSTVVANSQRSILYFFYNAADAQYTNETGPGTNSVSSIWRDVRVVGSTARMISTTLSNSVVAGSNVQATVASNANMYIGQRLYLGSGSAANGYDPVVIEGTSGSTFFTADFAQNHGSADAVKAYMVYSSDIVADILAAVGTANSGVLNSSSALIRTSYLDVFNEVYEDASMVDVLDKLAGYGDGTQKWEWRVEHGRQLAFQPQGATANTWYVAVTDLQLEYLLETLRNAAYAVYTGPGDMRIRTSTTSDAGSIATNKRTRTMPVSVDTTSSAQAGFIQAVQLSDTKTVKPRAALTFTNIYDANGIRALPWQCRAGDTIIIRNLPPGAGSAIDRIRIFRILTTTFDAMTGVLTVEPELPPTTLETLVALQQR